MGGIYINGEMSSHATVECAVTPETGSIIKMLGITSVKYDDELARTPQFGTSSVMLGSSRGQYKPTAELEVYYQEFSRMLRQLAAGGGISAGVAATITAGLGGLAAGAALTVGVSTQTELSRVVFGLVVTDRPKGGDLRTDKIPRCIITKISDSSTGGDDGRKTTLTLQPHGVIDRGGVKLVDDGVMRRLAIR